ncbi:MAG: PEP-CTERM sorting domain-containing protein [Opitutales bacterium]|nr:PEP-CTERM sorting domain-containing protein [Opitutales bacterium]
MANGISLENTSFELVIDDISTLQDKQLNEYFETITLAGNSIENLLTSENLTVLDKESGILFDVSISDSGIITLVPESSTYAAIFGALALAFAAYRRRK